MEKMEFKMLIDAPKERVWDVLWGDTTYRQWTAVFSPGSRADTDWEKGSKVLFLNDNNDGMVSMVAENIPNEYMAFIHHGVVKKGIEDTVSDEAREWTGATENYTLKTVGRQTELTVDGDIADEFKDYFMKTWPKAMEKVKQLAEVS